MASRSTAILANAGIHFAVWFDIKVIASGVDRAGAALVRGEM